MTAEMKNDEGKRENNIEKETKKPFVASPEDTGLTPEEEAYVPRRESRPLPRSVFVIVVVVFLLAFTGGGALYYNTAVHPEKMYQMATRLSEGGNYEEALVLYKKVLRRRPERREILYKIGYCQEMLGMDHDAAQSYAQHLESQPRDEQVLLRLGNIMLRGGRFVEALSPFEQAVKISPKNAETHYSLAKIYEQLDSKSRAGEHYLEASRNADDPELLLASAKGLMGLALYKDALLSYERLQEITGSDDKRGLHGATAARNMLGWPHDATVIITPGKSLGRLALGMSRQDVVMTLGEPEYREERPPDADRRIPQESWIYSDGSLTVYFQNGRVNQITTTQTKYRTSDGIGLKNFLEPKYADRFERFLDSNMETPGRRYLQKGGGLAFYASGEERALIVYRSEVPPTDIEVDYWTKIADETQ